MEAFYLSLHCVWYAVVLHFWMPKAEQSSSTRAEVKFAPWSLSSLAGAPNMEMNCLLRICTTVFAFWSLVTKAITYLVKWSVRTRMFLTLGSWFSSMVVSMLVKSTWTSSRGAYAWMGQNGAFTTTPSNILQCWHPLTNTQQSSSIFGHQKCSPR